MARQKGLTKKEKAFCEYYALENLSAIKSYEMAYDCVYNTAKSEGYRMLRKPHIKEYIDALQKEVWDAACITAEKVGMKLAEIAFAEKDDVDYTPNQQLKALDLLGKQLGIQHQKIEADVNTEIEITIGE